MKITNYELAYDGYFKIGKYDVENKSGKVHTKECFERGDSVAAIIWDANKERFIFTKQYRIGSRSEIIEIVAGSMDVENETPEEALIREIGEELGYKLTDEEVDAMEHIASVYVSPGGTSERIHIFLATVTIQVSNGGGIEDEEISIVEMTTQEILDWLPKIEDAKTLIGVLYVVKKSMSLLTA